MRVSLPAGLATSGATPASNSCRPGTRLWWWTTCATAKKKRLKRVQDLPGRPWSFTGSIS